MSAKSRLQPAFPTDPGEHINGMTLRDYFAAKAMASQLGVEQPQYTTCTIVRIAYEFADAMLAERIK